MPVSPVCPKAKGCTEHMQDDVTAEIFFLVFFHVCGFFCKAILQKKRCFKYILLIILIISDLHEIKYFEVDKPFSVIAFERKGNN